MSLNLRAKYTSATNFCKKEGGGGGAYIRRGHNIPLSEYSISLSMILCGTWPTPQLTFVFSFFPMNFFPLIHVQPS